MHICQSKGFEGSKRTNRLFRPRLAKFSLKSQIVNVVGFVGYMWSLLHILHFIFKEPFKNVKTKQKAILSQRPLKKKKAAICSPLNLHFTCE